MKHFKPANFSVSSKEKLFTEIDALIGQFLVENFALGVSRLGVWILRNGRTGWHARSIHSSWTSVSGHAKSPVIIFPVDRIPISGRAAPTPKIPGLMESQNRIDAPSTITVSHFNRIVLYRIMCTKNRATLGKMAETPLEDRAKNADFRGNPYEIRDFKPGQ